MNLSSLFLNFFDANDVVFRFAEPKRLYLLAVLPILWWIAWRCFLRKGIPVGLPRRNRVRRFFRSAGVVFLSALCLLAFARPQLGRQKQEERKPVVDLLIALDVSTSMLAEDFKPDRLAAAKKILNEFLDKLQNARVGLVVFAGRAFTQCPLTADLSAVKRLLEQVEIASVRVDGTAIGDALVMALNRLQKGSKLPNERFTPKENRSRAVILLTDGENNRGTVDPLTAARLAADLGVKVYAIGVGTVEGVPAPFLLPDGRKTYAVDRFGNLIRTRLDERLLKEIAARSGGIYFNAADEQTLRRVFSEIARLEKREVTITTGWRWREISPWILALAFGLFFLNRLAVWTVLRESA